MPNREDWLALQARIEIRTQALEVDAQTLEQFIDQDFPAPTTTTPAPTTTPTPTTTVAPTTVPPTTTKAPEVFDPNKLITNAKITDNNDGTVTFTWDHFPGTEEYRVLVIPEDNRNDFSRLYWTTKESYIWTPDSMGRVWKLAIAAYIKNRSVVNKGSNNPVFTYPMPVTTTGAPTTTAGPFPTPPPTTTEAPDPLPPMKVEINDYPWMSKEKVNRMRDIASRKTTQWQNFISFLDANLRFPIYGDYQGSEMHFLMDYAAAYRVYKDDYPERAAGYANKVIAGIKAAYSNYKKGPNTTCQKLEQGDGIKTTFTIPNADFYPETFKAYLAPTYDIVVTRAAPPYPYGNYDENSSLFYATFLPKIVDQNGVEYLEGVDWQRNRYWGNNTIDWGSLNGKKPAPGTKYTVTCTSVFSSHPEAITRSGNQFTFKTPPKVDQHVFVEYGYGTQASDYSTLSNQETCENTGGPNSAYIDASYETRNLKFMAMGLALIDDYPGLKQEVKDTATVVMMYWYTYCKGATMFSVYLPNSPTSNYGVSHWCLRCIAVVYLAMIKHPQALTLYNEMIAWRDNYLVPTLSAGSFSLAGGFWVEGWSYGPYAVQNLLVGSESLAYAGKLLGFTLDLSVEKKWAGEVILHLIHAAPSSVQGGSPVQLMQHWGAVAFHQNSHYAVPIDMESNPTVEEIDGAFARMRGVADCLTGNGLPVLVRGEYSFRHKLGVTPPLVPTTVTSFGDWFAYPPPFPGKTIFYLLSEWADDPQAKKYANYVIQNVSGQGSTDWLSVIYQVPNQPTATWENERCELLCKGSGLLTTRSAWGNNQTWLAVFFGNVLNADHQAYTPGDMEIVRAGDILLCNANTLCNNQYGYLKSTYGNLLLVDSNGDVDSKGGKIQTYPFSMGVNYGKPGVTLYASQLTPEYNYIGGNYRCAYNAQAGFNNPTTELTREVVFLRPGTIVVFDRVTTLKPSYLKRTQWHFLPAAGVGLEGDNSFSVSKGNSMLWGQTWGWNVQPLGKLQTIMNSGQNGPQPVQELTFTSDVISAKDRIMTVFQVTDKAIIPTAPILNTDAVSMSTKVDGWKVTFGVDDPNLFTITKL